MPGPRLHNDNDAILWDYFRNDDKRAYTFLINKYSQQLFNYGYRFCQDKDVLKDCIQEVFFQLWDRRHYLNPTESVKNYLLKAIRLRIFRDYPGWQKNERLDEGYSFLVEFNIEAKILQHTDEVELAKRIKDTLNLLPSRQKEAMYLRFYENLSFDEIAEVMHLNRQSVHNLLQKAYNRFRSEWAFLLAIGVFSNN